MCSGAHGNDPSAWPPESSIDFLQCISQHVKNVLTSSTCVLEEEQSGGFGCSLAVGRKDRPSILDMKWKF